MSLLTFLLLLPISHKLGGQILYRRKNYEIQSFKGMNHLQLVHFSVSSDTFPSFFSGRLGENMSVKRAVMVDVPAEWHIGSYVHGGVGSNSEVAMGRYGSLVIFQGGKDGERETLGRKLGQHIVGESPVSLGNMDDLPCGESETRLLPQTFLGDPSRTVAQFLRGQQARVLDFVRFQCGETTSEEVE